MKPLIAYIRVSTQAQGKSGLGIEAQREAIRRFAEAEGLELAGEHVEIETGKGADALDRRPKLAAALAEARRAHGAVVVAKLDRLSRDVAFDSFRSSRTVLRALRASFSIASRFSILISSSSTDIARSTI